MKICTLTGLSHDERAALRELTNLAEGGRSVMAELLYPTTIPHSSSIFFISIRCNEPIAWAAIYWNPGDSIADIGVYVEAAVRRFRIGTMLVENAVRAAAGLGMTLRARPPDVRAMRFYTSLGVSCAP